MPDPHAVVTSSRCGHGSSPVLCGHCEAGTRTGWVEVGPVGVRLLLSAEEARQAAATLLDAAGDLDEAPVAGRVEGRLMVDGQLVGSARSSPSELDDQAAALERSAGRRGTPARA